MEQKIELAQLESPAKHRRRQLFDALEDDRRALTPGTLRLDEQGLVFTPTGGKARPYPLQRLKKIDGPGLMGNDLFLDFDNGGRARFVVENAQVWVDALKTARQSAPPYPAAKPPLSDTALDLIRLAIIVGVVYLVSLPCLCLCGGLVYYYMFL